MLPHRETTVVIDHQITFGNRTREILRTVESCGIDLIVLRSHQVDPAAALEGWGTISHKIAIMASCPVMLMK
jgi:SpoU rRNA methylase family enzyme